MWMFVTSYLLIGSILQAQCDETLAPNGGIEKVVPSGQKREVERGCGVRLPHKATARCRHLRAQELVAQKEIFQLDIRPGLSMPLVNMTVQQLVGHFLADPFASQETGLYINMLRTNKASSQDWLDKHPEEITDFAGYEDIFTAYRSFLGDKGIPFYKFASNIEPFQSLFKDWRDDQMFTEQRLSGVNPMVLRRVTNDTVAVGLKWSELQTTLNPNFDWDGAVRRAVDSAESLEEAIQNGSVYVLRYEVFDDMITTPDIMDDRPGRTMWQTKSPVALFAVEKSKDARLQPVAIQIDFKPDSPVFTPDDGGAWTLAKLVVQATDYAHSQMIEHLLKTHLLVEPFCVALQRHLSSQHPLHVILKYHCRGIMVTNTIGSPTLITPGQYMDKLTPMGYKGTLLLLQRGYKTLSWRDSDFHRNIKKRGVGDKGSLPYYPYRDDGGLLFDIIKEMAKDYVNHYYKKRRDVRRDSELQAFVNELSADGKGPDGGRGQIKDFPATLKKREEVADILARLIFLTSVQHAALNYPVSDYGAFTPATPTKIYNDSRVPPGTFAVFNLPNVNISTVQAEVAMNVGTFHYDTLFDYHKEIPDDRSARIVRFYHFYLKYAIRAQLRHRNEGRYSKGHLTYPYFQYPWLPNGIQT